MEGDSLKNTKRSKLAQLFLSVFKLSACTFGGGFVIVPLMRKRFVEELGWIEEQEMLSTFNCGIGLTVVVEKSSAEWIRAHISQFFDCYEIGVIQAGDPKVSFCHHIAW